ncbi:MAG: sigma-70 family RNA polymerase sigma factor [Chthoniobacteraceae bacterium]
MSSESNFHTTHWTLVLRASGESAEAKAALSELCEAYYAPVIAFLRREGRDDDAAREMAHAFFAGVLASGVGAPERERGRFRSYLLGALKHFLGKQRAASLAEKRGAGAEHLPIMEGTDTSPGLPMPAASEPPPELHFDREWAFTLIARALAALEADHADKAAQFAALKPWLDGGVNVSQADAAKTLGMSETAVKVIIHRMRVRFRELIRAEVAATVHDPGEIADELRHLIAIASTCG